MNHIISSEEACNLWQAFENKYTDLYSQYVQSNKVRVELEDNRHRLLRPIERSAGKKILSWWRQQSQSDKLLPIQFNQALSDQFNHFVALNSTQSSSSFYLSINSIKKQQLHQALMNANLDDAIFFDPHLPYIALALFKQGQYQYSPSAYCLSYQQLCTILERHQVLEIYPKAYTFNIFDRDGSLNHLANKYLLPTLSIYSSQAILWQNFCTLVKVLPKSEQIYSIFFAEQPKDLSQRLKLLNSMYYNDTHGFYLLLSTGVRESIYLAQFGLEQYIRPIVQLCNHQITDIERGVRHQARYTTLKFPGHQLPQSIHGWNEVNAYEITCHDYYHSQVYSLIPTPHRQALLRMVDVLRQVSGHNWSKEIWEWIDSDFSYYLKTIGQVPQFESIEASSQYFVNFLEFEKHSSSGGWLINKYNFITFAGMVIFLDMIEHKSRWKDQFLIDPDCIRQLKRPMGYWLSKVYDIHQMHLSEDEILTNKIFKLQLLLNANHSVEVLKHALQHQAEQIYDKVKIVKNKSSRAYLKNTLYLNYEDKAVDETTQYQLINRFFQARYKGYAQNIFDSSAHFTESKNCSLQEVDQYIQLRQEGIEDLNARFRIHPDWDNFTELHEFYYYMAFLLPIIGHLILYIGFCLESQDVAAEKAMEKLGDTLFRPA